MDPAAGGMLDLLQFGYTNPCMVCLFWLFFPQGTGEIQQASKTSYFLHLRMKDARDLDAFVIVLA